MGDQINGNITVPMRPKIIGGLTPRSNGEVRGTLGTQGTRDYNHLVNKPRINSVELVGNKTFLELGVRTITSGEILDILNI